MTRIISVISGKGGVGKSTIAANVGAALASDFKKDVIIIDCNLATSHLSLSLGMYYCPITLNNVLRGEKRIFDVIYGHPSGMKVIPASLHLREMEGVDVSKLKDVVAELKGRADYVILDTAPGLEREAHSAISASDEVIIVANPNLPSVADVIKCREITSDKSNIGIVLNMVRGKGYELSRKDIEKLTELPVIASVPYDDNVHRSLAEKKPVVMLNPRSKSSREFVRIARLLAGEREPGFFSRLLGRK